MPVLDSEKDFFFFPSALKPAVIFLLPVLNSFQTFAYAADALPFLSSSNLVWKSLSWLSFSFC